MTFLPLSEGPATAIAAVIAGQARGIKVSTSGSTGESVEVLLSGGALLASADATHQRLSGPGQWLLALPDDRIAGAMVRLRAALAGTTPVPMNPGSFSADGFARATDLLTDHDPRYVSLVPTQLGRLLAESAGRDALASYAAVLVGGGPIMVADVPANVIGTYGLTETAGGCVYDGALLAGVEVDIDDAGRVMITGPMLADGYSHEVADAWVTVEGRRWLRTSDIGEFSEGRLVVLGRADDVINTGGLKVHPLAVERALNGLPNIVDSVVVPVADPEWGQRVVALVEVRSEHKAAQAGALREALAATLARHELPREVYTVQELPRLVGGKIDRMTARHIAQTRATA